MIWQDIVLGVCYILLAYALVPEVINNHKKKKPSVTYQTSIITFVCLYVVTAIFLSLKLYFSALIDFFIATLWLILFLQRLVYK